MVICRIVFLPYPHSHQAQHVNTSVPSRKSFVPSVVISGQPHAGETTGTTEEITQSARRKSASPIDLHTNSRKSFNFHKGHEPNINL